MIGKKEIKNKKLEQMLPLLLEIIPGQAKRGIAHLFYPSEYQGKSISELAKIVLSKEVSLEEREIMKSIKENLEMGKLLYNGEEVSGDPLKYAVEQVTEANQKYYLVQLRAIGPQKGGR